MKCPKCNTEMNSVKIDETIVDKCPKCDGIWLNSDGLGQIMEKHELDAVKSRIDARPHDDGRKDAACPSCGGKMIQVVDPKHDLCVETCKSCYGHWLDGNDISKLKEESFFGNFVKNLF